MDKRNDDPMQKYRDITAQRRHRRAPRPETSGAVRSESEADEPLYDGIEPLFAAWEDRREAAAEPAEDAVKNAAEETGEETAGAAGEEIAEAAPEKTAASLEEPVISMEPVRDDPPAEEAEEKEAAKPEENAGTGEAETAAPEKPEEVPAAVQAADSRVPPEARLMAASPYGTARPDAKRPGTRPQVAPKRPAMPSQRRPAAQQRRPAPLSEQETGARQMPPRGQRVRVGYAPGRMSDGMTRQVPAQDTVREPYYARDAKAYLEKRNKPFRAEEEDEPAQESRMSGHLRVAVAILVALGLLITGIMFGRGAGGKNDKNKSGNNTLLNAVLSFELPEETENLTAPADLFFSAETVKEIDDIRLRAANGQTFNTTATFADSTTTDSKIWMMKISLETGFSGKTTLQVRKAGEDKWYNTEYTANLQIASPLATTTPEAALSAETPTPAMNGEVVFAPDPEETEEPAEETPETPEPDTTPEPAEAPAKEDGAADDGNIEEEETTEDESGDSFDDDRVIGELRTVEPTATPEPQAAEPTTTPPLVIETAAEGADPSLITSTIVYSGSKKEKAYARPAKELIHMPEADQYTSQNLGVLTFRGDNFRRNAAAGTLKDAPVALEVAWDVEAGSLRGASQFYYGYGWTGQPAIARWSKQVRAASNMYDSKLEKTGLKEVIIAGLDGVIRFLDLEDGSLTRNSIKMGYPMRGTPSLHTLGEPFMSVGQFARKLKSKTGNIGLRQYNLYSQKELKILDGLDGKLNRQLNDVGSFETSALIDRTSDTLIVAGTNGLLYLEALNSSFDYNAGVLSISPSIVVMNSKAKGQKNTALTAVESSLAAYDKYVFYADMGGILRCVNTDTLKPVWAVDTGDSVMAAIAMDLTAERELNLYTANMLNNRKKGDSSIQIRQYDALTGREKWTTEIGVYKSKKDKDDVGAKASPVIGQNALNGLVYFTVTGLSESGRNDLGLWEDAPAALIALNKSNGTIAWVSGLTSRSESSPVAVYDDEGNGWIIQCEQNGTIRLLDGLSGNEISTLKLEAEIEASPAVYGNMMVIGTTGKGTSSVYGIEIRIAQARESEESNEENSGGA